MNKQQILEALEGLKELTNDSGKRTVDAVKAGIAFLQEDIAKESVPQEPPWPHSTPEQKAFIESMPKIDKDAVPELVPTKEAFRPLNVTKRKKGTKK